MTTALKVKISSFCKVLPILSFHPSVVTVYEKKRLGQLGDTEEGKQMSNTGTLDLNFQNKPGVLLQSVITKI